VQIASDQSAIPSSLGNIAKGKHPFLMGKRLVRSVSLAVLTVLVLGACRSPSLESNDSVQAKRKTPPDAETSEEMSGVKKSHSIERDESVSTAGPSETMTVSFRPAAGRYTYVVSDRTRSSVEEVDVLVAQRQKQPWQSESGLEFFDSTYPDSTRVTRIWSSARVSQFMYSQGHYSCFFRPRVDLLRFPVAIGTFERQYWDTSKCAGQIDVSVKNREMLRLESGGFDVWQIDYSFDASFSELSDTGTRTEWFSTSLGVPVKLARKGRVVMGDQDSHDYDEIWELKESATN
jgi:hypothetical protein